MNFSFIHAGDIHLGRPFSGLSKYSCDENIKEIYKTAVEKVFNNITDFAISKNVDFVLAAGDTFDSSEQDFASKLILKEGLQKLIEADIKVFLICGNHDYLSSYNKNTFNYDENSKVKIIGLNTAPYCEIPLYNRENQKVGVLHALSYVKDTFGENPLKYFDRIKEEEKNLFNIGLLHCSLNGKSSSPYAPCSLSEMRTLNYNYWALGHIHLPSVHDNGIIQYSGTPQGRNTKETGPHGIRYIEVSDGKIIKNDFIELDIVRFEDIEADISCCGSALDALSLIEGRINEIRGSARLYLIRLNLKGSVKFFEEINEEFFNFLSDRITSDFSSEVHISQITNSTIPAADETILSADEGITGEIYKTAKDENILQNAFNDTAKILKTVLADCCFTADEYDTFMKTVKKSAEDECINLCAMLYNSEKKEDN